jgi:hypothetical protein
MKMLLWLLLCWQLTFSVPVRAENAVVNTDAALAQAFRSQQSNLQVEGVGVVIKLLPDDNRGSRHQRFLLRLNSGDSVAFYGEYEWSHKGGTLHWTHHDPAGRHVAGWLKHGDRVYQ